MLLKGQFENGGVALERSELIRLLWPAPPLCWQLEAPLAYISIIQEPQDRIVGSRV